MDDQEREGQPQTEWQQVERHLAAMEFDQAAEGLKRLLAEVRDPAARGGYYQLLASAWWCRGAEEVMAQRTAQAAVYRGLVRETYAAALSEFPQHTGLRVAAGLFILMDESNPRAALAYTEPVAGQEVPADVEHKRLAVRGVTLAMLGRTEESMDTLLEAYGGVFPQAVGKPDISPLGILVKRGVRLPAEGVARLIDALGRYPGADPAKLQKLREGLAEH